MHFFLSQLHLSQLNEIFFLFVEMKIELSTLSPVTTSSTIHQEITTLKRKRKEGSVLLFSISIIVLLQTVFPY